MARNKTPKPLTEAPPEPDSSEEDSSSTEIEDSQDHHHQQLPNDDEASSSSSSDDDDVTNKKLTQKSPAKKSNNSSDDDDDDDDEDDSPPVTTKQKTISLTTPPPKSSSKPRSKPNVVGLASDKPDKRALEVDDTKDKEKEKLVPSSKKPRKEKEKEKDKTTTMTTTATTAPQDEGANSSKKQVTVPFQRLFSDNDEIVILKGMIDYKVKKGVDPMIDVEEFYGFIKGLIGCEVSRTQFVDKVRRLKNKYFNACKKKKQPSSGHDLKLFELGKKIWGSNSGANEGEENEVDEKSGKGGSNGVVGVENSVKSPTKLKVVKSKSVAAREEEDGKEKEWKVVAGGDLMEVDVGEEAARERVRKKGLKLMGAKARGELAEMWDKVVLAQKEVDEMRFEVLKEENRRIVEALKSSKA